MPTLNLPGIKKRSAGVTDRVMRMVKRKRQAEVQNILILNSSTTAVCEPETEPETHVVVTMSENNMNSTEPNNNNTQSKLMSTTE